VKGNSHAASEQEQALYRDAALWRVLMDPRERRLEDRRAEALRGTARGAAEDWLEARGSMPPAEPSS
jgi:hypothetical protein